MKKPEMSHEEIRQIMVEQFEQQIEDIAMELAVELYPDRVEETVARLKVVIRQKLETVMRPEDKLYLMPTTEGVS